VPSGLVAEVRWRGALAQPGNPRRLSRCVPIGAVAFTAATIGYQHRPGDTGPHLPLWDRLPTLAFWLLPSAIGAAIVACAVIRARHAISRSPTTRTHKANGAHEASNGQGQGHTLTHRPRGRTLHYARLRSAGIADLAGRSSVNSCEMPLPASAHDVNGKVILILLGVLISSG
jgi:hypothetical protein